MAAVGAGAQARRVRDSGQHYAALGDSISIDLHAGGPGRGGASLLHRNRDEDFPEWRGRDLATEHPGCGSSLLAVDGGTCRHLLEQQLPRLEALGAAPTVVTLTVGGNDLLGAYGDTAAARAVVAAVGEQVDAALSRVRGLAAPEARIAVATVYDPSDGTGDTTRVGLPAWRDAPRALEELNAVLRDAAARHGARVADLHARFLGHGLSAGDPAQHDPRPPGRDLWFCGVIEPNAWGADAVRAAFWDAVRPG